MRSPSAIEVRTLGVFEITQDGQALRPSRHAPRRQWQLLKVLVALGGRSVPIERIAEAIWPDAEGDLALDAFHTTLRRLRRRLAPGVVMVGDGRATLNEDLCGVDALEFQAVVEEAGDALEAGETERALRCSDRVLRLYQGPFLEGEFEPAPISSARARWHTLFLRHVERMGRALASGSPERGLALFRTALVIDPAAEEVTQALMGVCLGTGRVSEGLAAYESLHQTLSVQFGIEPGEASQALRRELYAAARSGGSVVRPPDRFPLSPEGAKSHAALSERRAVAVVMSRFTGLAHSDLERLDAELAEIRAMLRERIAHHGGVLERFGADGFTALFGATAAHEDDPLRATRAALGLHDHARTHLAIQPHTGVAWGLALVGMGGSAEGPIHLSGEVVAVARALSSWAGPGELLIGEGTRRRVSDFVALEAFCLPESSRGIALSAWKVVGDTQVRTRFQLAERRGLTPYVGRERERDTLRRCWHRAMAGRGQLVTVSGEAGMGKSRLVHELAQAMDREAATVLEGTCPSTGPEIAYFPFRQLLHQAFAAGLAERLPDLPERVVESILAADPGLDRFLAHYLHLLSIPSSDRSLPTSLSGDPLRRELHEALAAALLALARRRPLLIVFEDWQWADEASRSALRYLLNFVAESPVLVAVLYRPEEFEPDWGQRECWTPIALQHLEEEDTRRIFEHVLGGRELPPGLVSRLHDRTGGNPFFNEELALALRESGHQLGMHGSVGLEPAAGDIELPESVQATLQARLARLPADERELLKLASVIGQQFDREVLERIAPSPDTVAPALERLAQRNLVHPLRLLPRATYRFNHVLTREVAYRSLPASQSRRLHASVGEALESVHSMRLEEQLESLSHHYSESDAVEKALDYLERAGDKAVSLSSAVTGLRFFERAVKLAEAHPDRAGGIRKRIDLILKWAEMGHFAPGPEMLPALHQARELALQLGDRRVSARCILELGAMCWICGRPDEAYEHLTDAVRQAAEAGDPALEGMARHWLGRLLMTKTDLEGCTRNLDAAAAALEHSGRHAELADCRGYASMAYGSLGRFDLGQARWNEAYRLAQTLGNRVIASYVLVTAGHLFREQGDWTTAFERTQEGIATSLDSENPLGLHYCQVHNGCADFMLGNRERGIAMCRTGIQGLLSFGVPPFLSNKLAYFAEILAFGEEMDEARRVVTLAQKHHRPWDNLGTIPIHRALARIAFQDAPTDHVSVEGHLRQCLEFGEAHRHFPQLAVSRFRRAEFLQARGEGRQALEELTLAEALFRELHMPWWLDQAAALRRRLDREEPFHGFAPYVRADS